MIALLVAALCWLVGPTADSERLRATAPSYLTDEAAVENLIAARVAGAIDGEDPSLLLAIAWHESRYTSNVVSAEPGGRVSCGVMTPVPHAPPCEARSLVEQYLEGAENLHAWRAQTAHPVLGYAGLAGACSRGPVLRRGRDLCEYENDMLRRAAWIRGARS